MAYGFELKPQSDPHEPILLVINEAKLPKFKYKLREPTSPLNKKD